MFIMDTFIDDTLELSKYIELMGTMMIAGKIISDSRVRKLSN